MRTWILVGIVALSPGLVNGAQMVITCEPQICDAWNPIYNDLTLSNSSNDIQWAANTWAEKMRQVSGRQDIGFQVHWQYLTNMTLVQQWSDPDSFVAAKTWVLTSGCIVKGHTVQRSYRAEISVNMRDYTIYTGDAAGCPAGQLSFQALMLHEIGHWIGACDAIPSTVCLCPDVTPGEYASVSATMSTERTAACYGAGFIGPNTWAASLAQAELSWLATAYQGYVGVDIDILEVYRRDVHVVARIRALDSAWSDLGRIRLLCMYSDGTTVTISPASIIASGDCIWELCYDISTGRYGEMTTTAYVSLPDNTLRGPYSIEGNGAVAFGALEFGIALRADGAIITIESPTTDNVHVVIYDIRGRRVREWSSLCSGIATMKWEYDDISGKGVASGVYLIRCTIGGKHMCRSMCISR